MRSASRVTGVSINTVSKLLIDAGTACAAFHDAMVRNVPSKARSVRRNLGLLIRQAKERQIRQGRP